MVAKRNNREINREVRFLFANENAYTGIGNISKNMELFLFTKGQFSLINVIETILKQTGKVDIVITTWTAANAEIKKAEQFLKNGNINRLHFIVDRSFPTRQPRYYKLLRDTFGEIVTLVNTHAKTVTIKNNEWNIVIRTSANLNENKRIENFEISNCKILFDAISMFNDDLIGKEYNSRNFELLGTDEKYNKYKVNNIIDNDIFDFDFNDKDFNFE